MKKIILPVLTAIIALGMVSCVKDYTERNTNPEQATQEMKNRDNLVAGSAISQMIANVLPSYQNDGSNEYGSASYQVVQGLTGNIFAKNANIRPFATNHTDGKSLCSGNKV